jgi:hypothetical protein
MHAIETTGRINDRRSLELDEDLPVGSMSRVRVIILFPETDDLTEQEWLRAAASNPVFDFLKDPAEDIYTLEDGEPFDPNDVDAR